ncbi:crotonase/enoyl-CoA hydratase family protein [Pseudomonas akapageensis]|uniref:crotonase/enoyl-CoA hydratase family protein n=1 Tax=Pseudomonas akapageensis TaxID=2609961 RepID=UPI00140A4AED|nr:crotonase/enoyl-CoA hydratase family protein [Pseudomonas akapageensis]
MTTPCPGHVTRELRGQVMLIGLDRPAKCNAFDLDMLNQLSLAYGEFERNQQARVAVVHAHGEHFTAGLDLVNVAATLSKGWEIPQGGCDPWGVFGAARVSKPVIVAVKGYCLTIGIELMLAADINLCASNTRFAQLEVQRGIFPFGGATVRLQQIAGWGNAMRWLLTGDEFDSHEALHLGLVQEVMATEDLMPRALELATRIARQAPLGVQAILASARQALLKGETQAISDLQAMTTKLLDSEDAREGMAAMLERRLGDFKGQ